MLNPKQIDTTVWIFVISFFSFLVFWFFERTIGIGWYYHLDSFHYLSDYKLVLHQFENIEAVKILGKGYYIWVSIFNGEPRSIIFINGLFFSLTNIIIYRLHLLSLGGAEENLSIFIFFILLCPYRVHLATTPLKETILCLFLALFFWSAVSGKVVAFLLANLTRKAAILYTTVAIPSRFVIPIFLVLVLGVIFFEPLRNISTASFTVNLQTRSWDVVPTFQEHGHLGNLIRFLVWPVLLVTGTYLLISPSALFLVIAVCQVLFISYLVRFKKPILPLNLYLGLGLIAVLAPGFSSYIRYAYPLMLMCYVIGKPSATYCKLVQLIYKKNFLK